MLWSSLLQQQPTRLLSCSHDSLDSCFVATCATCSTSHAQLGCCDCRRRRSCCSHRSTSWPRRTTLRSFPNSTKSCDDCGAWKWTRQSRASVCSDDGCRRPSMILVRFGSIPTRVRTDLVFCSNGPWRRWTRTQLWPTRWQALWQEQTPGRILDDDAVGLAQVDLRASRSWICWSCVPSSGSDCLSDVWQAAHGRRRHRHHDHQLVCTYI